VQRAIPLFERVLAGRQRVLGDDHPETMASWHLVASAYQEAGDMPRAVPLYERVLAGRRRVLGDDHPQTLASASNLADDLGQLGDHHAAGALRAEVKHRRSGQGEAAPDIEP
jgi:hypothetical protein